MESTPYCKNTYNYATHHYLILRLIVVSYTRSYKMFLLTIRYKSSVLIKCVSAMTPILKIS